MKTVASVVREKLGRAPPGSFFRTTDFRGPRSAVECYLSRLAAGGGRLLRVRRGLYWKGGESRFGAGRPPVDEVVRRVAGDRAVGPAGWSASHALGLSTQVPAEGAYAVVGAAPAGIPGVRFHCRRNLRRLGLRYLEVALLEVLRDWPSTVETDWSALVDRVAGLRDAGHLRPARLRGAVAGERGPAVRALFARLDGDLPAARRAASPDPE
ncbi:MAG: hypothetical protein L6R43_07955 [Planctomycetes bacterium]|nr:hypothetical protein [Planctomycetota bacterium]